MNKIQFTTPRHETVDGWARSCRVNNVEYRVYVRRGKSVRIPYKPRGKNRGWQWNGSVYREGLQIWSDRVPGSIGVRGLLDRAHQQAAKPIFAEQAPCTTA